MKFDEIARLVGLRNATGTAHEGIDAVLLEQVGLPRKARPADCSVAVHLERQIGSGQGVVRHQGSVWVLVCRDIHFLSAAFKRG